MCDVLFLCRCGLMVTNDTINNNHGALCEHISTSKRNDKNIKLSLKRLMLQVSFIIVHSLYLYCTFITTTPKL